MRVQFQAPAALQNIDAQEDSWLRNETGRHEQNGQTVRRRAGLSPLAINAAVAVGGLTLLHLASQHQAAALSFGPAPAPAPAPVSLRAPLPEPSFARNAPPALPKGSLIGHLTDGSDLVSSAFADKCCNDCCTWGSASAKDIVKYIVDACAPRIAGKKQSWAVAPSTSAPLTTISQDNPYVAVGGLNGTALTSFVQCAGKWLKGGLHDLAYPDDD